MNIIINEDDLIKIHAELNQITGIVMGAIAKNSQTTEKDSIQTMFSGFVGLVDQVNEEMQKYAIT